LGTAPVITIYVRHSADCKYAADEFSRRCDCRKHLRWTHHGKQHRRQANTRSWAGAEEVKRELADQLSGKEPAPEDTERDIRSAVEVFVASKQVQNLTPDLIKKYKLWLGRLASHCEGRGVHTVRGINGEVVIGFMANWEQLYPSTLTRQKLRERYKSFMRFCEEQDWLTKLPPWPTILTDDGDGAPTMPLEHEEYERLLDAVFVVVKAPQNAVVENQTYEYWTKRVHGFFQLMRWSGLTIMDALTLRRSELFKRDGHYRIVTQRTKTGTDVSVVMPPDVGEELLAVPNDNDTYFFWSGVGSTKSICGNWGKRFIVPCFNEAGIECGGHMRSHRLRDTFAVEMLNAGSPLEDVSKALGHKSIRVTENSYGPWVKGIQTRLDKQVMKAWETPAKKRGRAGRKRSA
jgi:integrase/recombinase XerD